MMGGLSIRWLLAAAAVCLAAGVAAGATVPGSVSSGAGATIVKGPYLQNARTDGVTVCWVTEQPAAGLVRVQRGRLTAGRGAKTVRESAATLMHKVRLAGLRPYTRYQYTVECAGEKEPGGFITAAPPGQPFRFVAYGDNRTHPEIHAQVLARIMQFRPDFILNTGDLVADGENEALWTEFFRVAEPALRDAPFFPALGNHERDGAAYLRYFDVQRDYSFDYGDAHFVALDSNRPPSEWQAQGEWLRQDLAAHQGARWRVVFFHHTPYTCVVNPGRRELAERLRARLEPIFLAGKVQLVLNGHDHDYQHHFANGIHYVVTGGGGAPLYDVRPDTPFVRAAKKAHHDCEITVSAKRISVRAVEPDGTQIDAFEIRRTG